MNDNGMMRWALFGVLAGLSGGCATAPAPSAQPVVEPRVYVYGDDAGSQSRVERTVGADGREVLHGETELSAGGRLGRVVEDATLGADGSLEHAEIAVYGRCGVEPDQRVSFNRKNGLVEVRTADRTERWRVPTDAPWALLPPSDASGRAAATPVMAWIALRAAPAGVVRMIDADRRWTYRLPSDQVAVTTETGTTIVLGNDGVDTGSDFVDALHLDGAGVSLGRFEEPTLAPALACGPSGRPGVSRFQ